MFRNRKEAGQLLAGRLAGHGYLRPVVLALPSGGVPVAFQVAAALGAPLDVLTPQCAGALGQRAVGCEPAAAALERRAFAAEREELAGRLHRSALPPVEVAERSAILVGDALVDIGPVRTAVHCLRGLSPRRIIVAAPVAARPAVLELAREVDAVVCLLLPARLWDAGQFYEEFEEVTDLEVTALLERVPRAGNG